MSSELFEIYGSEQAKKRVVTSRLANEKIDGDEFT